ncbi:MAG: 30S ribosomal protein S3 [Parcubacteria group bacterium Greene0714_7]|nr:30S ribosomal protein S3 [Candidatus Paceibacterota bacterium]MBP9832421.1 30S ribosomal protein S3 [Candidatus Paceibacterota bacterium]TAK58790.1 MAG: 30S ribosomal protein S3 [Patescibacteria group bacterium]TSD05636.1 MAG: 30S ribosomal protein S3 [Parcubacteria group bacterium Greene0714_7]
MTKIVHPYAHRLGILRDWQSRWFAGSAKKNREFIRTDAMIRQFLTKRLRGSYVSHVEIERSQKDLRVQIHTARPGMVIGRSGEGATKLKKDLHQMLKSMKLSSVPALHLDVIEVRSPESNAAIVAGMVVESLEKRLPFRRVLKQTIDKVMANRDVKGVRIAVAGMLGSGSMSRTEELKRGRIPLQTFRADIDYAQIAAQLPLGKIGVKVWIYRGDIFADDASRPKV